MTIHPSAAPEFVEQLVAASRDKAAECESLAHKLDRADPLRPALISARNNLHVAASELAQGLTRRQEAAHVG